MRQLNFVSALALVAAFTILTRAATLSLRVPRNDDLSILPLKTERTFDQRGVLEVSVPPHDGELLDVLQAADRDTLEYPSDIDEEQHYIYKRAATSSAASAPKASRTAPPQQSASRTASPQQSASQTNNPAGNGKSSSSHLSGGAIAGIVIGIVAFIGIILGAVAFFVIYRRKKRAHQSEIVKMPTWYGDNVEPAEFQRTESGRIPQLDKKAPESARSSSMWRPWDSRMSSKASRSTGMTKSSAPAELDASEPLKEGLVANRAPSRAELPNSP